MVSFWYFAINVVLNWFNWVLKENFKGKIKQVHNFLMMFIIVHPISLHLLLWSLLLISTCFGRVSSIWLIAFSLFLLTIHDRFQLPVRFTLTWKFPEWKTYHLFFSQTCTLSNTFSLHSSGNQTSSWADIIMVMQELRVGDIK